MGKRKRLPVWTVRWVRFRRMWVVRGDGGILSVSTTKKWATGFGLLSALARREPGGVSVRIYRKDGRLQEERTYPRSADPRRSRG